MSNNGAIPWDDAQRYALALAHKRGLRHEDAQDVAQDAILKVWRARERVQHWRAYLYTAINNQVAQWHRHNSYRRSLHVTEEWPLEDAPNSYVLAFSRITPDQHPIERDPADIIEEQEVMRETMAKFGSTLAPAMLRIALLLAQGLSHAQAAERLGCSQVNIRVNKHRARRRLLTAYAEV